MSRTTRELEHVWFSRREMERRWERVRTAMGERDIGALMVTGEENFQYLTGTSASLALHHSLTRPSVLILPIDQPPVVMTQSVSNLDGTCYIEDVRAYWELLEFPVAPLVETLGSTVGTVGRVGVELGQEQRMGLPVGSYLAVVAALPGIEFVDAADVLIGARMCKSEEELVYMREAAAITGRARQRLFDEVVPGMTERQVVRRMRQLILAEGGDRTSFVILQHDDPGARNQLPLERELVAGTMLAVDAGAYVGMHTVDYVRMAMLGRSDRRHRELHKVVLEVVDAMKQALRPGVTCSEVHATTMKAIERQDCDPVDPAWRSTGRVGHGQGMLVTEPPSLCMDDRTVLEPGMVISTEPTVHKDGVTFQWEDVHVVTESGAEQITLETTELRTLEGWR